MFILQWKGRPPDDSEDWVRILREVFSGTTGSYRIWFHRGEHGWKFDFEWREDLGTPGEGLVANSPDSLRFNVFQALTEQGKPLDPDWRR